MMISSSNIQVMQVIHGQQQAQKIMHNTHVVRHKHQPGTLHHSCSKTILFLQMRDSKAVMQDASYCINFSNRIANLLCQSFPRRHTNTLQVRAGTISHKAKGQAQSMYDVDRLNKGSCSTSEHRQTVGCSSRLKLQVMTEAAASADACWLQ